MKIFGISPEKTSFSQLQSVGPIFNVWSISAAAVTGSMDEAFRVGVEQGRRFKGLHDREAEGMVRNLNIEPPNQQKKNTQPICLIRGIPGLKVIKMPEALLSIFLQVEIACGVGIKGTARLLRS